MLKIIKAQKLVHNFYSRDTMTVGELIEILGRFPQDAPVETEGCDCYGEAVAVGIGNDNIVRILRYA